MGFINTMVVRPVERNLRYRIRLLTYFLLGFASGSFISNIFDLSQLRVLAENYFGF